MAVLMPEGRQSFTDSAGAPLVGGKLFTYDAGTNNPRQTYLTEAGVSINTNPIILDGRGEAVIFWSGAYKIVLTDAAGATIWTQDNVTSTDALIATSSAAAAALVNLLRSDLANTANVALGASLIGRGNQVVDSIAALRLLLKASPSKYAFVTGYYAAGDGGGGPYYYDAADTTSADNGGTIIVASDGGRWKLAYTDSVSVKQFGAKGDNTADDTVAAQRALNFVTNGTVRWPDGAYKITDTLTIDYNNTTFQNCCNLRGNGQGSSIYWAGGNNKAVIWYRGTTINAGFYSSTIVERLYFKNNNASTGLIGVRVGNSGGGLGMGAGVSNVTIRNNKFISFAIGVQTEYESDGLYIHENVFETYSVYGVYNTGSAGCRVENNQFSLGAAGSVGVYCEYSSINVCKNLIQSTTVGVTGGIWLKNVSAFEVSGNYLENGYPGPAWAILLQNSRSGYIGHNSIQGMQGANAIDIDATSSDIEVGPNSYGFFGFPMASLVRAAAGARGVNVLGNQDYILSPVSISNATPAIVASPLGVVGMQTNQALYFTTTGSLPTGLTELTFYYAKNVSGAQFEVSLTPGGASVATSSAGSGVHTCHVLLTNVLSGSGFNFSYDNDTFLFGVPKYTAVPNAGITAAKAGAFNIGNNAGGSGWGFLSFNRSGVQIGSVTQSGTTAVLYNTTSDQDLKQDLGVCESSDVILNTVVHDFSWKLDGRVDRGLFAQEAYAVKPSAVHVGTDERNEDGNKVHPWGVDYSKYVPDLIVTCQQLHRELQAVKSELAQLKP